jgi:hypothetical protein
MSPPPRLVTAACLIAAAIVLPVRAGYASTVRPAVAPRLQASGPVHGGQSIEIEWAPVGAGPEELELLLSLDGGRTWRVRVSPELPGETVRYVWKVPNLAVADARVRLRVRVDGREIELPPSESFAIESDPDREPERRLVSEGPWWEGFEGPGEAPTELAGNGGPSLTAAHAVTASEEAPRIVLPARNAGRGLLPPSISASAGDIPPSIPTAATRNQPLRN